MRLFMPKNMRSILAGPLGLFFCFALLVALSGCGDFEIETPAEMVEVTSDRDPLFDYRATTTNGVVVGVRVLEMPAGPKATQPGADFWAEAVKQKLRVKKGYALLSETEVTSANGHAGTQLKFGRDQNETTFIYWLTLYRTERKLHLVDAAGRKDRFDAALPTVEKALSSYKVNP